MTVFTEETGDCSRYREKTMVAEPTGSATMFNASAMHEGSGTDRFRYHVNDCRLRTRAMSQDEHVFSLM